MFSSGGCQQAYLDLQTHWVYLKYTLFQWLPPPFDFLHPLPWYTHHSRMCCTVHKLCMLWIFACDIWTYYIHQAGLLEEDAHYVRSFKGRTGYTQKPIIVKKKTKKPCVLCKKAGVLMEISCWERCFEMGKRQGTCWIGSQCFTRLCKNHKTIYIIKWNAPVFQKLGPRWWYCTNKDYSLSQLTAILRAGFNLTHSTFINVCGSDEIVFPFSMFKWVVPSASGRWSLL